MLKSHLKSSLNICVSLSALALSMAVSSTAQAQLVSSGDLVGSIDSAGTAGVVSISNPTATTAVIGLNSDAVVADFTRFNVPSGNSLDISNDSTASTASFLARVTGPASDIGGSVTASDVNFWLVNQNGIAFGANGSVSADSFVASGLDVDNQDFFDVADGTNGFGNGTNFVSFSGTGGNISAGANAEFTANEGGLLFASRRLSLDGTFSATDGRAGFAGGTDIVVRFDDASPVSYTFNAGEATSFSVGGSVTAEGADFQALTSGFLQIDADVDTLTASAGDLGISISADAASSNGEIRTTGAFDTGGRLLVATPDDFSATGDILSAATTINADGEVSAADIDATNGLFAGLGTVVINAGTDITTGDIDSDQNIVLRADGGIMTANLSSQDGRIRLLSDGDTSTGTLSAGDTIFALSGGSFTSGDITEWDGSLRIIATDTATIDSFNTFASGTVNILSRNGGIAINNDSELFGNIVLRALNGDITTQGIIAEDLFILAGGNINTGDLDVFGTTRTNSGGNTTVGVLGGSGGRVSAISGGTFTAGALFATDDVTIRAADTVSLGNLVSVFDLIVRSTGGNINLTNAGFGDVENLNLRADAGNVTIAHSNLLSFGNIRIFAPNGDITTNNLDADSTLTLISGGEIDVGNLFAFNVIRAFSDGSFNAGFLSADLVVVNREVLLSLLTPLF